MTTTRRQLLGALGVGSLALGAAACSNADPFEDGGESPSGGDSPAAPGTLVVGSQAYYSNEILAELFAQVLEQAGFSVDRQYQIGQREVYLPELEAGDIDVMPEYLGNLLQNYDPDAESGAPADINTTLADALPDGLRLLNFAEATDQDSYSTTGEFAQEHGLVSIADLAKVNEELKIAANSEFEVRPYGPEGLKAVYGVDVTVVPVEDSGGPLTVQALLDGDVQLADLYTSDPAIAANSFVILEDPEALILPQNVVPVVTDKIDDTAAAAINGVIAALGIDDLIELNRRSVEDQAKSADIASKWLQEKGLL